MLSKWQTLFLLVMTLPIMGHVVILPIMLDVAGRDIVVSILLSLPAAILFAYAIFRLRKHYSNISVKIMFTDLLGKPGSMVLRAVLICYFLFLNILSLAALIDFVQIDFFPETPSLALLIWFMIFFLYATVKGYKRIALISGILALIAVVTGHTLTLIDSKLKDWSEMLPLLEFGWGPALWGSVILTAIWVELLLLLCVPIENIRQKRFFLLWIVGTLIIGLTMFSTANGSITIFGLGQAQNFNYPAQEIVRLINLSFIDRFDIYGMILMTFGVYTRCSLFFRIAYDFSLPENSTKWPRRIVFLILVVLTFFGSVYLINERFRIEAAVQVYAYLVVLFPIPFILLFISFIKKKRSEFKA